MLERVFNIWKQACLVEELRHLEVLEPSAEGVLGQIGDHLEQRERHVLADGRSRLQQSLVLRAQAIDASRENRLHGGGNLNLCDRTPRPVGAPLTLDGPCLEQCANAFLEKEWVALGPRHEEGLERAETGVRAEQRIEQLLGACPWQRVEP